jgi:hypothetical protein
VPLFNDVARVALNGFYSIFNCVYDKPNSTLVTSSGTGGSTNSIDYFQYIDADALTVVGTVSATGALVVMPNLPTSSVGLPAGALWNSGGFVKVV